MVEDLSPKATRLAALKMLTARALTSVELSKRLAAKGFLAIEIESVVSEFAKKRLLDDDSIAEDVIEYSLHNRLEGKRQARQRLQKRGISSPETEEKILESYTPDNEFQAALEFARKKARSVQTYPADVQRRRIGSALDRRGFPSAIIVRVLSELNSNTDSTELNVEDL